MEFSNTTTCISNDGYGASLEVGKRYRFIFDPEAEKLGGIRVVDEDGEDYFYDAEMFCPLQVPPVVAKTLMLASEQG